jgi:DUF1680 family protein
VDIGGARYASGWASLPARVWKDGDRIEFQFRLVGRVIAGEYTNYSQAAAAWGPFILAVDSAVNSKRESFESLRIAKGAEPTLTSSSGSLMFALNMSDVPDEKAQAINLVPFADAGATGGQYRIWLRGAH